MKLRCEIIKKEKDEITSAPKDGVYIHGLYLEGARWDPVINSLAESHNKEPLSRLPVLHICAVQEDKHDNKNIYECPLYYNRNRGSSFIWSFALYSRTKPSKWITRGVAMLLSN